MSGIYMKQFFSCIAILKKIYPKIIKWGSLALAGLLLTVFVLFLALQTELGFNLFISLLNRSVLEKNEFKIEVKDLSGIFPFSFNAGVLSLQDRDGRWVQVHN